MPSGQSKTMIIIPTYNEADNLRPMVETIMALNTSADILIIDDNSPDGTGEIADQLSVALPALQVIHRPGKLGLGTAYVAGFHYALEHGYELIFEMDCDFSHDPKYLPAFLEKIQDNDLVIGSRYVPGGGTVNWGWMRKFISGGGNLFARVGLGLPAQDCTAGFKCYRSQVLQEIDWDQITLQGYAFQVATVYHTHRLGFRIAEIPITFQDRRVGQSKMSKRIVAEAFKYVCLTRLRELLGKGPRRSRPQAIATQQDVDT